MAAAYDDYDYPAYWGERAYEHESEVVAINDFFTQIGEGQRVLDIGAGYGRLARVYAPFAKEITLVDPSSGILAKARSYLKSAENVHYIQGSLQNVSHKLPSKKFDVVVLVRVMHHIKDPKLAFSIISKLLPRGGFLIFEFANKLHGKAVLQNFMSGNFTFPLEIFPIDKRSKNNVKKHSILFLNHHPDIIESDLKAAGFKILDKRSVSNIRSQKVKGLLSLSVLMKIEKNLQKPLARANFGPSIFILAQKK